MSIVHEWSGSGMPQKIATEPVLTPPQYFVLTLAASSLQASSFAGMRQCCVTGRWLISCLSHFRCMLGQSRSPERALLEFCALQKNRTQARHRLHYVERA
jgi:hypothetical protein